MAKEIHQVKNYQVNQTMIESARNKALMEELAAVKTRQEEECYSVCAHQQANPNLVEMPVHKITKQIYDNSNNNRPMFYGLLKSDLPPSETAPPPPKSKDPRDAPN
ncbi:hypothetical protein PIB30_069317 [Stylosanthes scabra]|uniref:Uncharacterized protein n=1 Tax=Stylosanthes scabra TaxID=79078 RepID=A0ABU6YLY9_9FABA|nr:hypothetical protein [Stylosanthes scabra]